MIMTRSFFPVGQGAFYCEKFSDISGIENINVVYDCGSVSKNLVEEQIRNNFNQGEVIHALFISHLDEDHINGIPYLLKYCMVKKIFFPLLTNKNNKYMTLHNLVKSKNSRGFAATFINNPYIALDSLNLSYRPDLYQIGEDRENGFNELDIQVLSSGENVADKIFENIEEKELEEWIFIPFNFRQNTRIVLLEKALCDNFERDMGNEDLQEIWENGSNEDREMIKKSYRAVIGSFNTNSMTLFSGDKTDAYFQYLIKIADCDQKSFRICDKSSGCLYMGDYDASGHQKWKQIKESYKRCIGCIGCIQIPHHGSKHNYNSQLSMFDAYFIISAGKNNKYMHPHIKVLKDLLYQGHHPFIVTEDRESIVQLVIEHL